MVLCCALAWAGRAGAAVISEVLTGAAGGVGPYIELASVGGGAFNVVVLDGVPGRERTVRAVVTVDVGPIELVVLHEGAWSGGAVAGTSYVGVDDLGLDSGGAGWARRIVVTDGVTDWGVGTRTPALDAWAPIDVLGFAVGGWPIESAWGEAVYETEAGWGLSRHVTDGGDYERGYSFGAVDGFLLFDDATGLNPGAVNEVSAHPEPGGLAMLVLGAVGVLRRGNRRT